MKPKIVINCPKCKVNTLGEVVYQNYEIGVIFEQRIRCLSCNKYHYVKLDLKNKDP